MKAPLLEGDEMAQSEQPEQPKEPSEQSEQSEQAKEPEKKNILALAEQESPEAKSSFSKWSLFKCLCKSGDGRTA